MANKVEKEKVTPTLNLSKSQLDEIINKIASNTELLVKAEELDSKENLDKTDPGQEPLPEKESGSDSLEPQKEGPPADTETPALDPSQDPGMDEGVSFEELTQEYSQLSDEELEMHRKACEAACAARMSAAPTNPMGAPTPPPAPPMGGDPGMDKNAMMGYPAMKSELPDEVKEKLNKAESDAKELNTLKEEVEKLNQKVSSQSESIKKYEVKTGDLINALQKVVDSKSPLRKSIKAGDITTSIDPIPEDHPAFKLSKNEVDAELRKLDFASLSKSDRLAVKDYSAGYQPVKTVIHLLKK